MEETNTNREDRAMELKKVVYKERSTNKWAAEVINIDDPAAVGIQVWRGVYDSEEEAREAAQNEITRRMKALS